MCILLHACSKFLERAWFSQSYKPVRVRVWLIYKVTKNNFCLQLCNTKFMQNKYSNLKIFVISSQLFSCELTLCDTKSSGSQLKETMVQLWSIVVHMKGGAFYFCWVFEAIPCSGCFAACVGALFPVVELDNSFSSSFCQQLIAI